MIYSILHKNTPFTFILYPIVLLGIWTPYILLNPETIQVYYDADPMPLYKFMTSIGTSHWGQIVMLLATILFNAFLLSRINNSFRLIEKRTSINLFIFFILSGSFTIFMQFNPLQFSLTFLLLCIFSLFKIYKREYALRPVFEAGLFISLGSLFYANMIFYGIFIFLAIMVLLPFNWRQWAAGIFGILTPLVVTASVFFLTNNLSEFTHTVSQNITTWHSSFQLTTIHYIFIGIVSLIFIRSLGYLFSGSIRKISTRKYYTLLLFLIIITTIFFFSVPGANKELFIFIIPSTVFIISNYLENIRSRFWQEFLFILLLASSVAIQLWQIA
ncbi:MAG: DUF6427 family protein [Bacteroidales bacterium]